jgi:hypothetical protein
MQTGEFHQQRVQSRGLWSDNEAQSMVRNLEAQIQNLNRQLTQSAGKGLNETGKEALNWIRSQL